MVNSGVGLVSIKLKVGLRGELSFYSFWAPVPQSGIWLTKKRIINTNIIRLLIRNYSLKEEIHWSHFQKVVIA